MISCDARRKRRTRDGNRMRQILDEAGRIIGQRGYYGFSIQEVADACALTVAGVLHHVDTKDRLLVLLLEDRDRRDLDAVTGVMTNDDNMEECLLSVIDAVIVLRKIVIRNITQPEIVRLYSMLRTESLYPEHPAYNYFSKREKHALAYFERLVAGKVNNPSSVARQLLAMMGGLEEQWLRSGGTMDLLAQWDEAMGSILPTTAETPLANVG